MSPKKNVAGQLHTVSMVFFSLIMTYAPLYWLRSCLHLCDSVWRGSNPCFLSDTLIWQACHLTRRRRTPTGLQVLMTTKNWNSCWRKIRWLQKRGKLEVDIERLVLMPEGPQ